MAASITENVQVRTNTKKGRGLFAQRGFKDEETIFEESPIVSSQFLWNELYKYKACEYCLKSLETAEEMSRRLTWNNGISLPHPECCDTRPADFVVCPDCKVLYCNPVCRDLAFSSYHKVLCMGKAREEENSDHPLAKLQDVWRNMHYPPETSSIMLIVKMIAMVKQADDKDSLLSLFESFVQTTRNEEEQIAHKLLGDEFKGQLEVLRELTSKAIYEDSVKQWFTPEGFQSLFALIGTNGQGIGSSAISVWCKNCDKLELSADDRENLDKFIDKLYEDLDKASGTFLNCEGSGLYKLQSACNHSCDPNAEIQFLHNNHTLTLVALKDIAPEEEILISYLDECDRDRSRHSRQKLLRENYLFNCMCTKCMSQFDDPDVTSEEEEEGEDMDDN